MAFQRTVNITQAPGVAGDFASTNPRHSALSVEGGFVAGSSGVTVGNFAWLAADSNGVLRVLNSTGSGAPAGFIHRDMNALITVYLENATLVVPPGMAIGDLFDGGDFWVKNAGAGAVTIGMAAFANLTDGSVSFAASGSTIAGSIETKFTAATAGAAGELIKMTSISAV